MTITSPYKTRARLTLTLLLLMAITFFAIRETALAADTDGECPPSLCVEVGEWQFGLNIGLGMRSNPLHGGDDIPLVLVPQVRYYGERFFLENLELGWTLAETDTSLFNVLLTPSYDGVFFNRWEPGNLFINIVSENQASLDSAGDGVVEEVDSISTVDQSDLDDRQFSYMGGVEFSYETRQGSLQALLLSEITGRHSGTEMRFAYQHRVSPLLATTLGFTWKDKKLTDYYYGVDKNEVAYDHQSYEASSSFNPFIRLSSKFAPKKNSWRFALEWQFLDSEISDSPVVEQDYVFTVFLGKQITF